MLQGHMNSYYEFMYEIMHEIMLMNSYVAFFGTKCHQLEGFSHKHWLHCHCPSLWAPG